jgi:hypothetical protein
MGNDDDGLVNVPDVDMGKIVDGKIFGGILAIGVNITRFNSRAQ